MSKPKLRARLATLSFSEKVKILEKLRDRDKAIAAAGLWKSGYIRSHLCNELHCLLWAATEWSVQDKLKRDIDGYHMDVYAMDSTFLHARALFEFFVKKQTGNHYSAEQFVGTVQPSDYYENWAYPLHSHLMHAQDRSRPRKLKSQDGEKDLNKMPVYFANEVLRLWKDFEEALCKSCDEQKRSLGDVARKVRQDAISSAERVVNSSIAAEHAKNKRVKLKPIFTFD